MVTEGIGSKSGKGTIINLRTASTTASFTEGGLVSLSTAGLGEMNTTLEATMCIGVCANGLPEISAARARNLAVQVDGVATVYGWIDETWTTVQNDSAIVPGDFVSATIDSNGDYDGQIVGFSATESGHIGIALEPVSTSGTRYAIKILLNK